MQTQLVDNVENFPGHIACDSESQSEIVVPIVVGGRVGGAPTLNGGGFAVERFSG